MRNLIIPISAGILCASFTIKPRNNDAAIIYNSSHLADYGLSEEAFNYAYKGYTELEAKNKLTNSQYLTICDFSQSSSKKRLYIIDMTSNELVINTYVAHGKNSGGEFASHFSNIPESLQSSLGFYVTESTYIGEHGLSLRLNGMEPGVNDKAYQRSIVIHGAAYVDEARAQHGIFMGRSFGCPAVPQKESGKIINAIKNGSCLFIYHPSRNYLLSSKLLNA